MKTLHTRLRACLAAAASLFFSHAATASTTFLLDLQGQGTHEVNAWECFPSPCAADDPRLEPVTFAWTGVLTLVTADDDDGLYQGGLAFPDGNLLSLSLDSNLLEDFDRPFVATALIERGQVVSLHAHFEAVGSLALSDMTASYFQPDLHHYGRTVATAVVTNVPEPSTWALMALGLAGIGLASRRRYCSQITLRRDSTHFS